MKTDHRSLWTLSERPRNNEGHNEGAAHLQHRPLFPLEVQLPPLSSLSMDDTFKQQIDGQCIRFDRYSRFLGKHSKNDIPWQSANSVRQTMSEIEQIVLEAERAINAKVIQLRVNVNQFASDVGSNCHPHWYRNLDDITAFDDSRFVEMLNNMPIEDIADFAAYLKETLPRAAKQDRPDHEYFGRTFIGKVHLLLEKVLQGSRSHHSVSLSLLSAIKAKVLLVDAPRVHLRFLEREHAYVDSMLLWLLDQHEGDAIDQYWDFAASWRELVYAWEELATDPGALIRLLDPLRKKSESEIRSRTMLAVHGRLPAELAFTIFEAAMLAEEIPLEPE